MGKIINRMTEELGNMDEHRQRLVDGCLQMSKD